MNELGELLGEAAEELSPTETLDDLGFARMVRSVRRRRVQRHTMESVVGVAAAGVVGTAAWAGLKYTAPAPADTPAPSVSATPTPTSTESPAVLPVPPTFGQVTAAPATAATIADARAGWVLALEQPAYLVAGSQDYSFSQKRLLLVSPTADRYVVLDLPSGATDEVTSVLHWTAGEGRALVRIMSGEYRWIDLTTGGLSAVDGVPALAQFVGVASTGNLIWQTELELVAVTPDGVATTLAYTLPQAEGRLSPDRNFVYAGGVIVDLRTGGKQFFSTPQVCSAGGWLSDTVVVVACPTASGGSELWSSTFTPVWDPPTMPTATRLYADQDWSAATEVNLLDDGRQVVSAVDGSGWGLWVVSGGSVTPLVDPVPEVAAYSVTTSGNLVVSRPVGGGEAPQFDLTAQDVSRGTSTVLVPVPDESGEPYGLGTITWMTGLADYVVGTAY